MRIKSVNDTKRIIDVGQCFTKMIAVIHLFQFSKHIVVFLSCFFGHLLYVKSQLCGEFFFTDATDAVVFICHRDVVQLVELAENTHLRELRDARDEDELQVVVHLLERAEEVLEPLSRQIRLFLVTYTMQDKVIILINDNDSTPTGLLVGKTEQILHSEIGICYAWRYSILRFIASERTIYQPVKLIDSAQVAGTEVEPQHRMFFPTPIGCGNKQLWLLYPVFCRKRLEELTTSFENRSQCGTQ